MREVDHVRPRKRHRFAMRRKPAMALAAALSLAATASAVALGGKIGFLRASPRQKANATVKSVAAPVVARPPAPPPRIVTVYDDVLVPSRPAASVRVVTREAEDRDDDETAVQPSPSSSPRVEPQEGFEDEDEHESELGESESDDD